MPDRLEDISHFYTAKRNHGASVLQCWERCEAVGDSVTPSIWSAAYREWIVRRIESVAGYDTSKRILSLGCGNAFVEADLVKLGYRVTACDLLEEAVELARSKGVDAHVGDAWSCHTLGSDFDIVYADGLIGHLIADCSVTDILRQFKKSLGAGGHIIISNDSAPNGSIEKHPSVPGFYYIHPSFLASEGLAVPLRNEMTAHFPYDRPESGRRWRSIATFRA